MPTVGLIKAYLILSGYTSRFAATAPGPVETDIRFDHCFGETALTLPADVFGNSLMKKIKKFKENFSRYESKMPDNMRTMLSDALSFDDSFDILEEFNFSI